MKPEEKSVTRLITEALALDLQESIDRGEWPPVFGQRHAAISAILFAPRPPLWRRLWRRMTRR